VYRFQTELDRIRELIDSLSENSDHFAEALRAEDVPHLSFSQVSTLESCEYRWYLEYVRGVRPDPVPEYFIKGRLLHEALAGAYGHIRGEQPLAPAQYHAHLHDHYQGASLHHLQNSMEVALQNLWQDVAVRAVEHPFVMVLDERLPPFVGIIDLVLEGDDALFLVDHKTGRSFYTPDRMQMALYSIYARASFGRDRVRAFYDQYRWVENLARIRKPAFQRTEVRVTEYEEAAGVERVRAAWGRIERIRGNGRVSGRGPCYSCPLRSQCELV